MDPRAPDTAGARVPSSTEPWRRQFRNGILRRQARPPDRHNAKPAKFLGSLERITRLIEIPRRRYGEADALVALAQQSRSPGPTGTRVKFRVPDQWGQG